MLEEQYLCEVQGESPFGLMISDLVYQKGSSAQLITTVVSISCFLVVIVAWDVRSGDIKPSTMSSFAGWSQCQFSRKERMEMANFVLQRARCKVPKSVLMKACFSLYIMCYLLSSVFISSNNTMAQVNSDSHRDPHVLNEL